MTPATWLGDNLGMLQSTGLPDSGEGWIYPSILGLVHEPYLHPPQGYILRGYEIVLQILPDLGVQLDL
jgi:hypothetical protein